MKIWRLYIEDRLILPRVEQADSLGLRLRGLLGRRSLDAGSGLWITPCGSIHTVGMRFAIDVVFLDAARRVTRIVRRLPPFRVAFGGIRARSALELAGGGLDAIRIVPGAIVVFRPANDTGDSGSGMDPDTSCTTPSAAGATAAERTPCHA